MKKERHAKKDKPFMITHSRRMGKILLIALGIILVSSSLFLYLAFNENEKILQNENRFRLLSCDEMKHELDHIVEETGQPIKYYDWRVMAYNDKDC